MDTDDRRYRAALAELERVAGEREELAALVADYVRDCGCDGSACEQWDEGACRLLERAMALGVMA